MANKWATLYNQLVKRHNKTRKKIIERSTTKSNDYVSRGEAKIPTSSTKTGRRRQTNMFIPDVEAKEPKFNHQKPPLVIPKALKPISGKEAEQITKEQYEQLKDFVRVEMKTAYDREWFKEHYKQNYLDVLREYMIGEDPEARTIFGDKITDKMPYSKDQIQDEEDEEKKSLMILYNKIYFMSTQRFCDLYFNGYIVKLEYIYHGIMDNKEQDFADEQQALIDQAEREGIIKKPRRRRRRRRKSRSKKPKKGN